MLEYNGIDPAVTMELTRAWSSDNSPKNAMSMLFAYAHTCLQQEWRQLHQSTLSALITSVNANLGFKGSVFRAVGFGCIGEKPTSFSYRQENSMRTYITRRASQALGNTAPVLLPSAFPLVPTKELAVLLAGRSRKTPTPAPLYTVGISEYSSY